MPPPSVRRTIFSKTAFCLSLFAAFSVIGDAQASTNDRFFGTVGQNTSQTISEVLSQSNISVYGGAYAISGETKTVGDVSITLTKGSAGIDDIFGGGKAEWVNSKSTVGNVSILIDVGDDYVTGTSDAGGGDIHGGGYAYHGKASNNPDHDNQSVTTIAGDTLIEFKSGILYGLLIGGGSVNGYASTDKTECLTKSIVGNTHIVVSGGTIIEAVIGGGKARISSEADNQLQGITEVSSTRIDINNGKVHGVVGGGWSESGRNKDSNASSPRYTESIVKGSTVINISGGTIEKLYQEEASAGLHIHNANFDGAVVGGGVAAYGGTDITNKRYSKVVSNDILINISGGTINGAVYAGGVSSASFRDDGYNNGEGGIVEVGSATVNITGGTINGNVYAGGASASYQGDQATFAAGSASVQESSIILGEGTVIKGDVYAGGAVFNTSNLSGESSALLAQNTVGSASVVIDSADVEIAGKIKNRTILNDGSDVSEKVNTTEVEVTATGNFNDGFTTSKEAVTALAAMIGDGIESATVESGESNNQVEILFDGTGKIVSQEETLNFKTTQFGETAAQNFMVWRLEMNDMNKRLGELRDSEGNTGIWVRVNSGKQKYSSAKNDFTSLQFGADTKLPLDGNYHAGLALSYTYSDFTYQSGNGDSNMLGLAGYASWLGDKGSFVDLIAKIARIESDSSVAGTDANYNTTAYSVSAEVGHRFELNKILFVEPQLELNYGHVEGVSFNTVNDNTVTKAHLDGTDSMIGRIGFRVGLSCPERKGGAYLKASVLREFLGDLELTRGEGTFKRSLDDSWFSYGIGGNFNFTPFTQLYADVERTSSADLSEPWRVNVGLRHSF